MRKHNEQGFIFWLILIGIGAVLGWKAYDRIENNSRPVTPATVSTATGIKGSTGADYTPTDETSSTDVSTWKTVSAPGGIASFKYPADWTLKGSTLTSPKGDMTISGTYGKGSLPACDPATCTTASANGISYTRTVTSSGSGVRIVYAASKLGYSGTATVTIPNDVHQAANIALADEIVGTIKLF